jgi:hypothetical protein
LGFTPLAKGSSFKALKTRPPSHSHLLHNPLCIAPGPPREGWEFGFAVRTCRLNTQEVLWYLTGHAYWHQHAPPEPYQPSVQTLYIELNIITYWTFLTLFSYLCLNLYRSHILNYAHVGVTSTSCTSGEGRRLMVFHFFLQKYMNINISDWCKDLPTFLFIVDDMKRNVIDGTC